MFFNGNSKQSKTRFSKQKRESIVLLITINETIDNQKYSYQNPLKHSIL